ncbi:MAG: RecX family transcriptional regulator, partial [Alphaproteobacteria bacterium]|nr:RecX family transcriptional regulator [Alphaproteobacteria bacterium]
MENRRAKRLDPKPKKPMTASSLDWFALRYVERFQTTEAKLGDYLRRKLKERGWAGDGEPPVDAVVARLAELGYVNDRLYSESKARGLERRGYGPRR